MVLNSGCFPLCLVARGLAAALRAHEQKGLHVGAPRQLVAGAAVTSSAEATTYALVIGVRPIGLGRGGERIAYQLIRARELLQTLGPLDLYLPPPLQLVHALRPRQYCAV